MDDAPRVASIRVEHFRNYERGELHPSPGLNVLIGPNAQGKTSLLEALSLVSTGRLLRGTRDAQAVQHGHDEAEVEAELTPSGTLLGMTLRRMGRKRATLNRASLPRASDLMGRLPSVAFVAEDLALVRGEPADRRLFLDSELAQLYPGYLAALTTYRRALEQRNALLRQDWPAGPEEFEPWEDQLAASGASLREYRMRWVARLAEVAVQEHAAMAGGEALELSYVAREDGDLLPALRSGRRDDQARGSTSAGPHRDDLAVRVQGQEARYFGSQGQQRTAAIALKLASMDVATEVLGFPPLLLLDDVFSELDQTRRGRLVQRTIELGGQALITCTDADQAGELLGHAKRFLVSSGTVREG